MKLLVVDDEPSVCFAMSDYFSALGYEVDCAQEADEAESLLAGGCYSAVVADLRLAGVTDMGGVQVIRSAHRRCPDTKVVVLTAHGSEEVEAEVRAYGVDAYLRKPIPLAEVARIILGLLISKDEACGLV